jgi:protein gp37
VGKDTAIEWCDSTFNPWWGCQRVSPGCEHCYAETFAKRVGQRVWGPSSDRRFFGDKHWAEPLKWAKAAREAGKRHRVFCASMADVFEDRRDLDDQRTRLWNLIEETPDLDWLLLTKRPENHRMVPLAWQTGTRRPTNVWLGTTTEDQPRYDARVGHLLAAAWPAVRFLSAEPLLAPVRIDPAILGCVGHLAETFGNPLIHWVIAGGESGPGARPMCSSWVTALRDQCRDTGAAFLFKQWGEYVEVSGYQPGDDGRVTFDSKRRPLLTVDGHQFVRMGKGDAGRMIAGLTYSEFPR